MYNEFNEHCSECICPSCDLFQTEHCLEDDACKDCDNDMHVGYCPWHPDEQ